MDELIEGETGFIAAIVGVRVYVGDFVACLGEGSVKTSLSVCVRDECKAYAAVMLSTRPVPKMITSN